MSMVLGLGLAGCTPAPELGQETAAQERLADRQRLAGRLLEHAPATLLWHSPDELASDVLVVQDVVLAYIMKGESLFITARDLHTGKHLWQRIARPGANPSGMELGLETVIHDGVPTIAIQEPFEQYFSRLVVLNALTGEYIWSGRTDFWGKRPWACDETWCVDGIEGPTTEDHDWRQLRLDWDKRSWVPLDPAKLDEPRPAGARDIGPGLSATDERGPGAEHIVFASDGKIKWKKPYEQIFAKRYSSDSGWNWRLVEEPQPILLGDGSRAYAIETEQTYQLDLSKDFMVVGVHQSTGEVAWRRPGADPDCSGLLPDWALDEQNHLVLCQIDSALATIQAAKDGIRRQDVTNLNWRAIAVDPVTGTELWSHELADLETFRKLTESRSAIAAGARHVILPLAQGVMVVDIADGTVRQPGEVLGRTVLCRIERDSAEITVPGQQEPQYVNVTPATQPCDRDTRKPTSAIPDYGEFQRAGRDETEIVVLSGTEGMLAYRMPDRDPNRR